MAYEGMGAMSGMAVMADREARLLSRFEDEGLTLLEIEQRMVGGVMANGDGVYEGLPAICATWDVPYGRVLTWLMADAGRYGRYKRALELQAHGRVAEVIGIVDAEPDRTEKGIDSAGVSRAKMRADMRLRVAAFHAPEMYRERKEVDVNVRYDLAARLIAARGRVAAAIEGESRVEVEVEVEVPAPVLGVIPDDRMVL